MAKSTLGQDEQVATQAVGGGAAGGNPVSGGPAGQAPFPGASPEAPPPLFTPIVKKWPVLLPGDTPPSAPAGQPEYDCGCHSVTTQPVTGSPAVPLPEKGSGGTESDGGPELLAGAVTGEAVLAALKKVPIWLWVLLVLLLLFLWSQGRRK